MTLALALSALLPACGSDRSAQGWDGKSTLRCGGSQHITVRNQKVTLDHGTAFEVGGSCELQVIDSDIAAPTVLTGGGAAHVLLQGGSITGSDKAIAVRDAAQVEIKGTRVTGAVDRKDAARISGLPELDREQGADNAKKALDAKWGSDACSGLAECYRNAGFVGQASARVIGTLAADGSVKTVEITGTPGEQRECLESTMKAKKVAGFDGGSGSLVCEFAGTWAAGNEDLTIGGGFTR